MITPLICLKVYPEDTSMFSSCPLDGLGHFFWMLESVKNVIVEYPGVTVGYTHSLSFHPL